MRTGGVMKKEISRETPDKARTPEAVLNALNFCYDKALTGIPKTKNCYELANEYLKKYPDRQEAAKKFINWQIAKCTTTGFVTGFGGLATMAIAIPADLTTTWYIQLRMIAVLAIIAGLEPSDDYVRTLAYITITGSSVAKALKEAGVQIASKAALAAIKKIPGAALISLNKKVGFRLLTKMGSKGVINLGKVVPVAGALVGAGFDFAETKVISSRAFKTFILNDFEE